MKILNAILSRVCRHTYHDAHVAPKCFADYGSTVWVRCHKQSGIVEALCWKPEGGNEWRFCRAEKVKSAARVEPPLPKEAK